MMFTREYPRHNGIVNLVMVLGILFTSANVGYSEKVTLRIYAYKGYAEPFVDRFKQLMKEKYQADVDLKITFAYEIEQMYLNALNEKSDLITSTHSILKSPKWPFIDNGVVIPIDCNTLENYHHIIPALKHTGYEVQNGKVYGVPLATGPYTLAYNADKVEEIPDSWTVLWDERYRNLYSISADEFDSNVYLTALALGAQTDDIHYTGDVFKQIPLHALRNKLNDLAKYAHSFWKDSSDTSEMRDLSLITTYGDSVVKANQQGMNWKIIEPKEGTIAWLDFWSITKAVEVGSLKHTICMDWINFSLSPEVQLNLVRDAGCTPVVGNINSLFSDSEIANYRIGDEKYWEDVSFFGILNPDLIRMTQALWRYAMSQKNSRDRVQEYIDDIDNRFQNREGSNYEMGNITAFGVQDDATSELSEEYRVDINVSIPENLLQRLRVHSIKQRSSLDTVINKAIKEYLERQHELHPPKTGK